MLGCVAGNDAPESSDGELVAIAPSTVPNDAIFRSVRAAAIEVDGDTRLAVDVKACPHRYVRASHGLGSGYVVSHVRDAYCEVWLGGEVENPGYDGTPLQYCLLERKGSFDIGAISPSLDLSSCIRLVAPVPDQAAFELASAGAVIPRTAGEPVSVDPDVCTAGRYETGGIGFAAVVATQQPSGARACEIFLATAAGPSTYCALRRGSGAAPLSLSQTGEAFNVDSPSCFLPAY